MTTLQPSQPTIDFTQYPNMKLYTGSLHPSLYSALNIDKQDSLPINQIHNIIQPKKQITMVRHLESKYNEYKLTVKTDPRYKILKNKNSDPDEKHKSAISLLEEYRKNVGFDALTDISTEGHKQGEIYGKLYGQLIEKDPDLFPTLIVVSPYLRTRLTTSYFLKYIKGLDIDLDKLTDAQSKHDLIIGKYKDKPIRIKIDNRVRERDHGSGVAPSYLREYIESLDPFTPHGTLSEDQSDASYYFNAPLGGESQVQVEERIRSELSSLMNEKDTNIMIVSHHIAILAALNIIFAGSLNTYFNLDNNRKPKNGSMTILSQIGETESGQKDKLRVAGYNLLLSE